MRDGATWDYDDPTLSEIEEEMGWMDEHGCAIDMGGVDEVGVCRYNHKQVVNNLDDGQGRFREHRVRHDVAGSQEQSGQSFVQQSRRQFSRAL